MIEHIFGVLKKHFPIIKVAPMYSFKKQIDIVLAVCFLHNFIGAGDELSQLTEGELEEIDQVAVE